MSPVGPTNSHMPVTHDHRTLRSYPGLTHLGPCPRPCLPRTHDTLWLHLWHMHDDIMHHALRPGTPTAPWCHHYIITTSFALHDIIHDMFLRHNNSTAALHHYDIITPPWHHQWLHNDTPLSSSSIRLHPWYHVPGPVPQISDSMTSYIMLMDYTLCPILSIALWHTSGVMTRVWLISLL